MLSLPWRRSARTTGPARITTAALLGSAASVAVLVATNVIPVPTWALDGVDVASHQHPDGAAIDWQAVSASGQKFAFIKATEGIGYTNPYFSSDSLKAQQAGVTPGSYHYARPFNDPRAEAQFYAAALSTGAQPSLPPVLDLEDNGGLSAEDLQAWTRTWIAEIKTLTGRDPIIYTYYNFWHEQMGNTTEFSQYPLWLAYYDDYLPNEIPGGWKEVTFWQHSDAGNVDGIYTNVDMNRYYGSDAQLQALASGIPAGTPAGDAAHALAPIRGVAGAEADLVNNIEHATGVDVPLTTDFFMLLLGVIGGRVPAETLLTQGSSELQAGASGAGNAAAGNPEVQRALAALTNALNEATANGVSVPVETLTALVQNNGQSTSIMQALALLQQFGGTQDWASKLRAGEVKADPQAMKKLADAAVAAKKGADKRAAAPAKPAAPQPAVQKPAARPTAQKPAAPKPAAPKPAASKPAAQKPAADKPQG